MKLQLAVIAILAVFGGLLALVSCQHDVEQPAVPDAQPGSDGATADVEMMTAELYFPGYGSRLKAERRQVGHMQGGALVGRHQVLPQGADIPEALG